MRTEAQLTAIGEVHELLEREGIEHWLFGGWAVDFHVGRVTRAHDDVDLAVWRDERVRIASLLAQTGWTHAPASDEDGGTGYERDLVRLELTFLVRSGDGNVWIPLRAGQVVWAGGSFDGELLALHGERCSVLDLAALTRTKQAQRDDRSDQAKDVADLAQLSRS